MRHEQRGPGPPGVLPGGISGALRFPLLLWTLVVTGGCSDVTGPDPWDSGDILDRLNALPGVQAVEIEPHYGYPRAFQLDITQPVDHDRPHGRTFRQRAYLSHVSDTMPMVFAPSGYGTTPQSGQELAEILQTNCLNVTHRYFPDARPDDPDWGLLTIHQAARDHHRVVRLIREIYPGKWVSTGVSKGGKTVVIHRRFFPADVDATVAYVAPFLLSAADERFEPYLRSRGSQEERAAVHAFQRRLLERQEELLPFYGEWFRERGYQYSLPLAPAFQSSVISYEWSFFQRHDFLPQDIPGPGASPGEMIQHLAQAVRLHYKSDSWRDYFKAYVYQTLTETGAPAFEPYHLYDLLEDPSLGPDVWTRYDFPPDLDFVYRRESMADVMEWAGSRGNGIIYIYGELDPWTAGAMPLTPGVDALRVTQAGQDHGVRIMELDQRALVLATLGDWMGLDVQISPVSGGIAVPPQAPFFGTPDDPTLSPVGF